MERWGSRLGALLALVGGAVGLGNFLRFPFQAAKWGGGAFLVPYVVALLWVGLPLVWMEVAMGRAGSRACAQSAPRLLEVLIGRRGWFIGLVAVYVSVGVAAYYAYLTGWTVGYAWHGLMGDFPAGAVEQGAAFHSRFLAGEAVFWWEGVLVLMGLVLSAGLQRGLEKVSLYGMPLLFLLAGGIAMGVFLVGETGRCASCSVWAGLRYLYLPRWEALLQPAVWLAATGQVFFTIGVGFGMYLVYSAAWSGNDPIRDSVLTVSANTFAEVGLGGVIVIPLVAAFLGVEAVQARAGFGMGFEVMPYVLMAWGGRLLVVAWYLLLFLAAFTSLIAMGWVGVTWLSEAVGGTPQRWAWPLTLAIAVLGVPVAFGPNSSAMDLYDQWVGSLFLVIAALGQWWVFQRVRPWAVVEAESRWRLGRIWRFIMQVGTPAFLVLLLVGSFFQPERGDWVGACGQLLAGEGWPWAAEALPVSLVHHLRDPWSLAGFLLLILTAGALVLLRRRT